MLAGLRHLAAALFQPHRHAVAAPPVNIESPPAAEWHVANWSDLLCSPMDARHYAMQDWTRSFDSPDAGALDYPDD